ncbi:MAG TPA: aminotransferase class III-fold pyridoxal phosphate-dependent enzyme [Terriglobales bacterium]|nr:aminotransferase class III-fold pyridoxal phosphate-dependent enzyme [Terriglobales bacterium]
MQTKQCEELVARDKKVIAPCQHLSYFPLAVEKVQGAVITDADGNEFIDFLSSASSLNLGSCHPVITAAIERQMREFTQYTQAYTYNRLSIEYAERLVSVYPGGAAAKVCFGNCGSDANDAAVKFARAFTGRHKILSFLNGYHGNTYGSSSLTTCTPKMRDKMGPFLPEIYSFPFFGIDVDDAACERDCLAEMERAFASYLPVDDVAAVIIEPMQGDGGLLPAHPIFMKKLYELCRKNGILFISEEVQQAFFRTGAWFSIEHYNIVPDGIVLGKSIGGSLTLGAFMGKAEIMDCLPAPAHLFTLGGNSIACAAGIAAFDYYKTGEFQKILSENTALLCLLAENLRQQYPDMVGFIRNLGMSMGIGITKTSEGGATVPDLDGTFKILYRCYELGLIMISVAGNVLRIQPPLVIEKEQLKKAFAIIAQAMDEYRAGKIPDDVLKNRAGW